ncbi:MAG TPA: NAD-dependent epimerase/dehydratase family protein [Polyangiaceae bacterium LLY-WYZ-15_(1-7)]|nr:NAD-dependent epimerase/dehydratase family protein [Polyangiaceae bacterium LLY-WYZ-15_(1-7)]HJL08692.1 NAD-dependent epimerase/dehydratase family protein [Polyangiaceae bacterium LLY-WYZ-15_(1-7)]HJL23097.1 NAD-dependent epimerase/dehydratase family protein [Polyangiaceae bacterium LLY-WYZ-15_(1-7)]HJL49292.1 NAD-dependent epimerase/dehydratase family protein [Polyangiaceae bacterium LLY-WYZ-15_(1-7)]
MTPLDGHRVDVLVTGAAGFVGEALVGRLLELGRRAVGVDLRAGYHPTVRMDVTDPAEVDDVFARYAPAKVVHAAAVVDERVPPATTRRVNVEGTRNVLEAALRHGVERFVQVSSIAALGLDPGPGADEHSPLVTDTGVAYFDTKAASERHVRDVAARGELEVVVARPGDVFGPGSEPWVRRPLEMMRKGQPVLIDGGEGLIAHCWIDNLVDGLVLCLDHPAAPGGVFAFHDGADTTRYRDYFARLARAGRVPLPRAKVPLRVALAAARTAEAASRLTGQAPPLTVGSVRYVSRRATYSLRASREVLGWAPKVDLKEAMARLGEALP